MNTCGVETEEKVGVEQSVLNKSTKTRRLHPYWAAKHKSKCFHCHEISTDLKLCSKCSIARYCSKQCQREDWSQHKNYCGKSMLHEDVVHLVDIEGKTNDDQNRLLELKNENGDPLFEVVYIPLVCGYCKEKGLRECSKKSNCERNPWFFTIDQKVNITKRSIHLD